MANAVWALARQQHGVVARWQLIELGASRAWVEHRVAKGRLHPVHRGVYAVGRPELAHEGAWMAAVLACGPGAILSHESAAELWEIRASRRRAIDVSLREPSGRRRPGIAIHRRPALRPEDLTTHRKIPVTSPIRTLIDLATRLPPRQLEAAVNDADRLDLVDPETLREALQERGGISGVRPLRALLDRHSFRLTESELERRFVALVRRAGLPEPLTQRQVDGFRVDFYWPELGLVVETDGWRYHRTPNRQARDNRRMQAHASAGRTAIRVSHFEIRYESKRVIALLADLLRRLEGH